MAKAKPEAPKADEVPVSSSLSWLDLVQRYNALTDLQAVKDVQSGAVRKADIKEAVKAHLKANADAIKAVEADAKAWLAVFAESNPNDRHIALVEKARKAFSDFQRYAG